jgi:hypothetical protein
LSISAQLTAHFSAREPPALALATWRAQRPEWLPDHYKQIDESYNSITWEWRHTPLSMKLVPFGGAMGGKTVYRLTALFQDDGAGGSKVTINGSCDQATHKAIHAATADVQEGGLT